MWKGERKRRDARREEGSAKGWREGERKNGRNLRKRVFAIVTSVTIIMQKLEKYFEELTSTSDRNGRGQVAVVLG